MQPEAFVEVLSNALFLVIKLVAAIIVPSLVVGLIVAIFQAATSINEQTLSFLPRLVVTLLALIIGAHWITQQLMDFFSQMIEIIPQISVKRRFMEFEFSQITQFLSDFLLPLCACQCDVYGNGRYRCKDRAYACKSRSVITGYTVNCAHFTRLAIYRVI